VPTARAQLGQRQLAFGICWNQALLSGGRSMARPTLPRGRWWKGQIEEAHASVCVAHDVTVPRHPPARADPAPKAPMDQAEPVWSGCRELFASRDGPCGCDEVASVA